MNNNEIYTQAFQELALIKFLLSKENFEKYSPYIKGLNFEKESEILLKSIKSYFEEYPTKEAISVEELLLYNSLKNPLVKQREIFASIFTKLDTLDFNTKLVEENFNNILENYSASKILFKLSDAIEDNKKNFLVEDIKPDIEEFENLKLKLAKKQYNFVSSNIKDILAKQQEQPGVMWRITGLNSHLGAARGRTLGHVFARVDTGKTSFIISEITNWISQLKDDEIILHLNNEEDGEKLMERIYQSFLCASKEDLHTYTEDAHEAFIKKGGDKHYKLYDEAIIDLEDIKGMLETYNVRVMVIDQADKLHFQGEAKLGDVARLQYIYAHLRELAKKYNVHVLTVGQAAVSAENKKWLMPSDMDSSKTLKPGEFDYIIGIGRVTSEDMGTIMSSTRYIHLCKNKLGTGQHAQLEVIIDTARALYHDKLIQGGAYETNITQPNGYSAGSNTTTSPNPINFGTYLAQ
jgi:acid stress-induced BolA-like protein IbaG/YrbA